MRQSHVLTLVLGFIFALGSRAESAGPAEPLLRELPPGLYLKHSAVVPSQQAKAIGQKLGGDIERLTNSSLQVHGRSIQVNVVTAVDESNSESIHASLSKIKPYPFCVRKGRVIVEYVGEDIDEALAIKSSYELGVVNKPERVRYRVTVKLATVDKADYMACNPLFNHFLALRNGQHEDTLRQINDLSKRFEFGRSLTLRNPKLGNDSAMPVFDSPAKAAVEKGAVVVHSFDQLPDQQGVPFVTAIIELTVDGAGLSENASAPEESLTAATAFWPSDDSEVRALAERITRGKATNEDKALAILQWLAPGKNLKYSGQTGSRWGTSKVLKQKFGHCWDFADCFVTLCRAVDVPSRQVAGWLYGGSGHVWAEFYREGRGWQSVDPTGGGAVRCGIYHIPYFTTEDGEMPIVYLAMPLIETVHMESP